MTWIDVASDAVKIGLGALIAGFFAVWGSARMHRHKLAGEYSRRRRDSLEKLSSDFDGISRVGVERVNNWIILKFGERVDLPMQMESKIMEDLLRDMPVLKCLFELTSLESKSTLLGFPELAEAIKDYRRFFAEIDLPKASEEEKLKRYGTILKELEERGQKVVTLIAKAYKNA